MQIWSIIFYYVNVLDSVNSAPIVKETPSRVVGRQGSRVELPCVSSAFPLPSYTWSRSGIVVNMTSRVTQVAGNLVLDHARLDDAGDYVCRTWNQLGSRDVSVRLVITGPYNSLPSSSCFEGQAQ